MWRPMIDEPPRPARVQNRLRESGSQAPVIDIRALLGAGREAIIVHAGERYRLRITARDKLILTK